MDRTQSLATAHASAGIAELVERERTRRDEGPGPESLLQSLSTTLGCGILLTEADGTIVKSCALLDTRFPGVFLPGRSIDEALDASLALDTTGAPFFCGPSAGELARAVLRGGELRRRTHHDGSSELYSHIVLPAATFDPWRIHLLVDVQAEKRLFDTYQSDLRQLSSMREIIDLLYESLGVDDVIDLILVAVTASQGFGFNRAFFLDVTDGRLRGRRGIGPATADEANRIWSQLDAANPSLRETLSLLSCSGDTPDPETQRLVRRLDLPLDPAADAPEDMSAIARACSERAPTLLVASEACASTDRHLFGVLGCDTLAVVPLTVRDRLEGVLLADNLITGRSICGDDLDLLRTFSRYAAIALEKSNLHDELKRNNEKLRRANHDLQTHQRKLLQAEKLSALGKMAACVSHEIRNPLVAIGGLARSALDDAGIGEDSRDALRMVVSEVERLERFLKETLTFVKPEAGPFRTIDLREVVASVAGMFREELASSCIDLTLELPEDPLHGGFDVDLLRGALSNLIRNAREAVGSDGRIGIHLLRRESWALIDIGDDGVGIPEEMRDVIFEPFFTNKEDGTGIGLALTKQNVRGLRGTIQLVEDPRYTTVFRICFPL